MPGLACLRLLNYLCIMLNAFLNYGGDCKLAICRHDRNVDTIWNLKYSEKGYQGRAAPDRFRNSFAGR